MKGTAASLGIDNALEFRQDEAGTEAMFEHERSSRMKYYERADAFMSGYASSGADDDSCKDFFDGLKEAASDYFKDEDAKSEECASPQ